MYSVCSVLPYTIYTPINKMHYVMVAYHKHPPTARQQYRIWSARCYCLRSGGIAATPNYVLICWFLLLFDDTIHRNNSFRILNMVFVANFLHYYHNLSKLKKLLFYICNIISYFGIIYLFGSKRAKK